MSGRNNSEYESCTRELFGVRADYGGDVSLRRTEILDADGGSPISLLSAGFLQGVSAEI